MLEKSYEKIEMCKKKRKEKDVAKCPDVSVTKKKNKLVRSCAAAASSNM